jgi:chemotaxis protein CheY-P-specific phosphatase CheC
MKDQLSELQRDALMETFNIGVGRASKNLAQLLGCEVAMSVPVIVQVSVGDIGGLLDPAMESMDVCSVTQVITGGVDADIVMLFQGSSDSLVAMMPARPDASGNSGKAPSDARAAIAGKIGYVVIESCVDMIQSVVGKQIDRKTIKFIPGLPTAFLAKGHAPEDHLVIVKIDLQVRRRGLAGHLIFSFSDESANLLAEGLDRMVQESDPA